MQEPDEPVTLPVMFALIVAGRTSVALPEPSTLTAVPVFVEDESLILMLLAVPHFAVVIAAEPSKFVPLMLLAVCSLVAVAELPVQEPDEPVALPVRLALMVAGKSRMTLPEPSTLTAALVLVEVASLMYTFLAAPHLAVVMFAEPSNDVPLMLLAVCSFVAVATLPLATTVLKSCKDGAISMAVSTSPEKVPSTSLPSLIVRVRPAPIVPLDSSMNF